MIKKNYLFYFFTDNIKFTPERFKIVSEIFDILVDTDENLKVGQILNIFDRADRGAGMFFKAQFKRLDAWFGNYMEVWSQYFAIL